MQFEIIRTYSVVYSTEDNENTIEFNSSVTEITNFTKEFN